MLPKVRHWFMILTCAVMVHGLVKGPARGECKRIAVFKKIAQGRMLTGHVISTHNVNCPQDCVDECLRTNGCKSYNYQQTGSPLHICQLNSHSKASAASSDYVIQAGYSYYDADDYTLPACLSSPCQNGGTCSLDGCADDYMCMCKDSYAGEHCEIWIGHNGSSTAFPGRSCYYIRAYRTGYGDGNYWIDPKKSASPFLVTCDMTTDGGGWTLIKERILTSSAPPSNSLTFINAYRKVKLLISRQYLSAYALRSMKNDMGFQQIRYLCRKSSVGRTVHIMTTFDTKGFDAVRYFMYPNQPLAKACGSYVALPDDNSKLSPNCDKLGKLDNGDTLVNRLGHAAYTGQNRLYSRMLFWAGTRSIGFVSDIYWCDDLNTDNLKSGDFWKMFVR